MERLRSLLPGLRMLIKVLFSLFQKLKCLLIFGRGGHNLGAREGRVGEGQFIPSHFIYASPFLRLEKN